MRSKSIEEADEILTALHTALLYLEMVSARGSLAPCYASATIAALGFHIFQPAFPRQEYVSTQALFQQPRLPTSSARGSLATHSIYNTPSRFSKPLFEYPPTSFRFCPRQEYVSTQAAFTSSCGGVRRLLSTPCQTMYLF